MKHIFTLTEPPKKCPTRSTTDAAFCGNGDLSVMWGGTPDKLCLYIGKSDFWNGEEGDKSAGGIGPAAELRFKMPSLFSSSYHVEEDLDCAEIRGSFADQTSTLAMRTVVLANRNLILLEMKMTGARLSHSVELIAPDANGAITERHSENGLTWVKRTFAGETCLFASTAVTAMKLVDTVTDEQSRTYRFLIGIVTSHDAQDCQTLCLRTVSAFTPEDLCDELAAHKRHWRRFWEQSSVSLPDEELEKMWYMGQYAMACCTGSGAFPPGLYGNLITQDRMAWHSDYHLNYNYEAPFYAATSSNHPEFLNGYDKPLFDFLPEGKRFARDYLGCRGIYYPVGIGPLGMNTSSMPESNEQGQLFNGQKMNASYAAVPMTMRWYGTYDTDYAERHVYPFLKEVAAFWEDYLLCENGRYSDPNDAAHEVHYYTGANYIPERHDDRNAAISLGLIRMVMRCLIDISETLDADADKRKKWKQILGSISDFPIFEKDGKPMFRLTEKGHEWTNGNGLDIQHVYPCSEVFFHGDPKLTEAARNSFFMPERWEDSNACSSLYPAAVRMGISSDFLLEKLRENIRHHVLPNGLFCFGGGGMENTVVVPAAINEMLMQSYEGTLRLFPNWNRGVDASFENLRANGAFLVSASLKDHEIRAVVTSEKGRELCFENPYDDRNISVSCNGKTRVLSPLETIRIKTKPGMTVRIG